jgi:hypothetical protein
MLSPFATAACTGELSGPGPSETGSSKHWLCEAGGGRVTCSAAIPGAAGEPGAYACTGAEGLEACPSADAFADVAGFLPSELLAELEGLPWACLLTGAHERHCTRDAARARDMEVESPPLAGEEPSPSAPSDEFRPASVPADCAATSWERYFCDHATFSYQSHGVDVAFPCDIFDVSQPFTELATASAAVRSTPGAPSCHEGEWAMREGAWLDAVTVGCMGLSDAILVMCQQAANYAPDAGVCNATGTW